MDYELSEDERALADSIRALWTDEDEVIDLDPGQSGVMVHTWFARLGEAGYLRAAVGEAGRSDLLALLLAQQELSAHGRWLVFAAEMNRLVAGLVADLGTPAQREALLSGLLSGEIIAAAAFTELGRSLSPEAISARLEPAGDGVCLTGRKDQVSLAPLCDLMAVLTSGDDGIQVLLVDPRADGVTIGDPIESLGYTELMTCPVDFAQVAVPTEGIIGPLPPDEQAVLGERLRQSEDRTATANALGIMKLCLDQAKLAANAKREVGKPPAGHQVVRFQLAEMLTLLQTAELLARRAVAEQARGGREAATLGLCAKVFATEAACQVSDMAMGVAATSGYRRNHPLAKALAEARFGTMAGNSSNAARMAIADDVLTRLANR